MKNDFRLDVEHRQSSSIQLLYVVGRPIGLPHIANPTQEDIDRWHGVYCDEVRDIYETYKERVPTYKQKKLYID
jgi:hypothetical protein